MFKQPLMVLDKILSTILVPELKDEALGDLWECHSHMLQKGQNRFFANIVTFWRICLLLKASAQIYCYKLAGKITFDFFSWNNITLLLKDSVNRLSVNRLVDIAGALIGLTVLSVIFLPIAIAIKDDSAGPIFYSQTRFGLQGKTFKIWKFRSMVESADALKHLVENKSQGLIFHDPRITRVGCFLRGSKLGDIRLDNFPQFWNVLRGDMKLVGTRPPTADEVAQYAPHHLQRLAVKPGMTGQWQVSGRSQIKDKDFEGVIMPGFEVDSTVFSIDYYLILGIYMRLKWSASTVSKAKN